MASHVDDGAGAENAGAGAENAGRSYALYVPLDGAPGAPTLGSVHGALAALLKGRGWRRARPSGARPGAAALLLGGPCGAGLPWKALRVHRPPPGARPPLVNFYRDHAQICRKASLARALRRGGGAGDAPAWLPLTFVFARRRAGAGAARGPTRAPRRCPAATTSRSAPRSPPRTTRAAATAAPRGSSSPRTGARARASPSSTTSPPSTRTSRRSRRARTRAPTRALDFNFNFNATGARRSGRGAVARATSARDSSTRRPHRRGRGPRERRPKLRADAGSVAWVASAYLGDPLLLEPGGRKFDVRIWVLVDADFGVHVWRRGVLRTCSVPFSNDRATFGDPFVHLSNHCVQERCAAYGAHESATNEVWLEDFDAYLAARRGASRRGMRPRRARRHRRRSRAWSTRFGRRLDERSCLGAASTRARFLPERARAERSRRSDVAPRRRVRRARPRAPVARHRPRRARRRAGPHGDGRLRAALRVLPRAGKG